MNKLEIEELKRFTKRREAFGGDLSVKNVHNVPNFFPEMYKRMFHTKSLRKDLFCTNSPKYWPAIISASGIVALGYRKLNKRQDERDKAQEEQLLVMRQEIKRIEFMQAVTLDYGLQIVGSIFDEYEEMGGNHYLHSVYEKYKKEKEEK